MTDLEKKQSTCENGHAELIARQQARPAKDQPVTEIQHTDELQAIEAAMLEQDQVDCPVQHHFGPGIYIREAFLPAGTYVMGHAHKSEHMNVMLKGKMAVIVDGEAKVLEAPCIFTGQAGRKFAYIIEDVVFQNIYATTETDLDVIEEMFVDKSAAWLDAKQQEQNAVLIGNAIHKHLEGALQ